MPFALFHFHSFLSPLPPPPVNPALTSLREWNERQSPEKFHLFSARADVNGVVSGTRLVAGRCAENGEAVGTLGPGRKALLRAARRGDEWAVPGVGVETVFASRGESLGRDVDADAGADADDLEDGDVWLRERVQGVWYAAWFGAEV